MEVLVKDRIVVLKGKADTEEEKKWAEETAASTPGVTGVKNELHVGSGLLYTITQLAAGIAASNDHELHKDKPAGEVDEKTEDSNG